MCYNYICIFIYGAVEMKTELHIHTSYSHDSMLSIGLIALICRIKGIDCIAVCDHNTAEGALKARDRLRKKRINVIVGEEIFTESGEIIGLFLNGTIPQGLPAFRTAELIREQGGLIYIPHPYDEKRKKTVLTRDSLSQIADMADFIEIHNGRNISAEFDIKQKEAADRYTDPQRTVRVSGSDAHTWFELGRNYMISAEYDTSSPKSFKAAMASAEAVTAPCCAAAHFHTKLVRAFRLLLKGNFNELYRIILRKCRKGHSETR